MSLKARGRYHKAYDVICDKYSLVIHGSKEHVTKLLAAKRQRAKQLKSVGRATLHTYASSTPA